MPTRSRQLLLLFGDSLWLVVALFVMIFLKFPDVGSAFFVHVTPFSSLFVLWLILFYVFGLYDLSASPSSAGMYARLFGALIVCGLSGVVFFYLAQGPGITPKTNLFLVVMFAGVLMVFWRWIFFKWSRSFTTRVGFVGSTADVVELKRWFADRSHVGYRLVDLASGSVLFEQAQRYRLDTLILGSVYRDDDTLAREAYRCLGSGTTVLDLSQAHEWFLRRLPVDGLDLETVLAMVNAADMKRSSHIKRLFDLMVATSFLIVSLPLWILIAIAIKADDRGRVFYSQTRLGHHGRPFYIYKFRTMRENAESDGAVWAMSDDNRCTRAGRILRRTHLDELPQLWNVLRGDLSLVGPRPERPEFVERLEREIAHYRARHAVVPGVTGWAQVSYRYARSVTDSKKKFEYDLYYVKNQSLWLDAMIILKTLRLLVGRE
jgi:exopolysaccharide biosynthesis polyprenyl glycosylphosphotransferase